MLAYDPLKTIKENPSDINALRKAMKEYDFGEVKTALIEGIMNNSKGYFVDSMIKGLETPDGLEKYITTQEAINKVLLKK